MKAALLLFTCSGFIGTFMMAAEPLPGGWGTPDDPERGATFTPDGKDLVAELLPKALDFHVNAKTNAPRVLAEVEGDFVMEVTVHPIPRPAGSHYTGSGLPWCSAGLVAMIDENNYVRLDRGGMPHGKAATEHQLVFDFAEGGSMKEGHMMRETAWEPEKPVRFRFECRGARLHAALSHDGEMWQPLYPKNIWRWPARIRVGVLALNTSTRPATMRFSDFKLTPRNTP